MNKDYVTHNEFNRRMAKTEQVEIIYDKDDRNKDWNMSGGIIMTNYNTPSNGISYDFSKYKKLVVYGNRLGSAFTIIVDLKRKNPKTQNYVGNNIFTATYSDSVLYAMRACVVISANKDNISFESAYYTSNSSSTDENNIVSCIEGWY